MPVHTVPDSVSTPAQQNFAVPPPGFAPGASGLGLEDNQMMQPVYGATPTKTTMTAGFDLRGGLVRQLKQKQKHSKFKNKQRQLKSNDQLFYMDGNAYQKVPQQNQVTGQQQQHQFQHHQQQQFGHTQQPAQGNYLLHPANVGTVPGSSLMSHPSHFLPGSGQYQGQQLHW